MPLAEEPGGGQARDSGPDDGNLEVGIRAHRNPNCCI
jgi:hypothetical protein